MTDNPQCLLCTAPEGAVRVDVYFKDEPDWLTPKALAETLGVQAWAVNIHLKNIFKSGELSRETIISKMEIARLEGARQVVREVEFYNLLAIHNVLLPKRISGELRVKDAERIAGRYV